VAQTDERSPISCIQTCAQCRAVHTDWLHACGECIKPSMHLTWPNSAKTPFLDARQDANSTNLPTLWASTKGIISSQLNLLLPDKLWQIAYSMKISGQHFPRRAQMGTATSRLQLYGGTSSWMVQKTLNLSHLILSSQGSWVKGGGCIFENARSASASPCKAPTRGPIIVHDGAAVYLQRVSIEWTKAQWQRSDSPDKKIDMIVLPMDNIWNPVSVRGRWPVPSFYYLCWHSYGHTTAQ